ncbi:MAG: hypothetical protein EHM20_08685 [Alphaproteobacteria bacterium]|nr:MAG: hypothetical protein EHM20_08685 [Alphaproteobacteria bacterium]
MRTPEEILSQKIGGSCGSAALAFAAILNFSGVSLNDIQIVEAVLNSDLKLICPVAGKPREQNARTGASGHVFVAVRFSDNRWILINTVDGSKNYSKANWPSPEEVHQTIKDKILAVPFEAYKSAPQSVFSSGLTVFQSWSLNEVPIHTFEQRLDLIASGVINQHPAICRFTVK